MSDGQLKWRQSVVAESYTLYEDDGAALVSILWLPVDRGWAYICHGDMHPRDNWAAVPGGFSKQQHEEAQRTVEVIIKLER